MDKTNDWTIIKGCFRNDIGYAPEINCESKSGIDITIRLFKRFATEKAALTAIEKILVKIPLKEMLEVKV